MSSLTEIEAAIDGLSGADLEALENRLLARRFGLAAQTPEELAALLASLDEAEREIEEGRGISTDALRRDVRTWLINQTRK